MAIFSSVNLPGGKRATIGGPSQFFRAIELPNVWHHHLSLNPPDIWMMWILTSAGLVDTTRHRGGHELWPENRIPAEELFGHGMEWLSRKISGKHRENHGFTLKLSGYTVSASLSLALLSIHCLLKEFSRVSKDEQGVYCLLWLFHPKLLPSGKLT